MEAQLVSTAPAWVGTGALALLALGAALRLPTQRSLGWGVLASLGLALSAVVGLDGSAYTVLGGTFGLQFAVVSAAVGVVVTIICLVTARYAARKLSGAGREAHFLRALWALMVPVYLLIFAPSLAQQVLAWGLMGLALRPLLGWYHDRPQSLQALHAFTRTHLWSLALLAGAAVLGGIASGETMLTSDTALQALAAQPLLLNLCVGLLIAGALLACAQFPGHGWLTVSMETPTPVSALLHAGVVNAGALILLSQAPLLLLTPHLLLVVALVGLISLVLAIVVMPGQYAVKNSLAWSTVGQMGFLCLQIGLGAFALAWLHLLAHASYKAAAFLGAAGLPQRFMVSQRERHPLLSTVLALAIAATVSLGVSAMASTQLNPGVLFASGVLILALVAWLRQAQVGMGKTLLAALALALLVKVLHLSVHAVAPELWHSSTASAAAWIIAAVALLALIAAAWFSNILRQGPAGPALRRLRVHADNAFYLSPNLLPQPALRPNTGAQS